MSVQPALPARVGVRTAGAADASPAPGHDDEERGASAPLLDLRRVGRMLRRRWWLPILTTALATGGAWVWTRLQATAWTSHAVVQVLPGRGSLGVLAEPDRTPGAPDGLLLSQVAILTSRGVLAAAADSVPLGPRVEVLGLDDGMVDVLPLSEAVEGARETLRLDDRGWWSERRPAVRTPYGVVGSAGGVRLIVRRPPAEPTTATLVVHDRDAAVDRLQRMLKVRPRDKTWLIDVWVAAASPAQALALANAVTTSYAEQDAAMARLQVRRRRDFIEAQLRETNTQLAAAEAVQSGFRGRTQAYSAQEKFAGKRAELVQIGVRQEELRAERRMSAELLARLERGDPRAFLMVPSTAVGATPSVSALHAQLVQRQSARLELVTGPRGLAATAPEVLRLDTLVAASQQQLVGAVQAHVEALSARLATLDEQAARGEADLRAAPATQAEETQLAQSVEVLREQAAQLRAEYQRTRIAEAAQPRQVEIVDAASRARPFRVPLGRLLTLAVALGLLVGVLGVIGLEAIDESIRSRDDLERGARLRVLGTIPKIAPPRTPARADAAHRLVPRRSGRTDVALSVAEDRRSPSAEAFRHLRTNLLYAAARHPSRAILVTSAREHEGKTSVAVSLAISFAQQRLNVVLVDCDFHRSRVARLFDVPDGPGLRDVLAEGCDPCEVLHDTPVAGLSVLVPGKGADMLDAVDIGRLREVLATLGTRADVVIVDSAPVLAVADTITLGVAVDAVLLVTRVGRSRRGELAEALRQLDTVGAHVLGGVLNDPDDQLGREVAGYYGYSGRYAGAAAR